MATILYIAGHGRSGSTLLNSMLAHWTAGAGVGEVAHVAYAEPTCRCGSADCPLRDALQSLTEVQNTQLANKLGWHALLRPSHFQAETQAWDQFFSQLSSQSECKTIIDASKSARASAGRAVVLSKTTHRLVIIHLKRDVRAIVAAYRRGCNVKLEAGEAPHYRFPAIRAVLSWSLSNLASLLLRPLCSNATHIALRYRDMFDVEGRTNLLQQLQDAGVDIALNEPERGTFTSYTHQTLGNRLASAAQFTLALDERWRR